MNSHVVLNEIQAARLANLALNCIQKEFPNRLDHTLTDSSNTLNPRALHPAFYGCFDWHSSVHGHWMLVRIMKTYPRLDGVAAIRGAISQNLSETNLLAESAYLERPGAEGFERPYGWAWLLKLAEELQTWNDVDAQTWCRNLKPLVDGIVERYLTFFPKLTYPLRTGTHSNSAFGLAFAWDYAETARHERLQTLIRERSMSYFAGDHDYPARWEPGGEDFFSAALMEADLMRRVMDQTVFANWFHRFLPGLSHGEPKEILDPVFPSDRADGRLVHLDGLNLSRAWCMRNIIPALHADDPVRAILARSAELHAEAGLEHVASGDYMGEHWLASFAVYMLSTPFRRDLKID